MFIQTEITADPNSMKFLPGRTVLPHGTVEIRDRQEAARSPLAAGLFAIEGVAALTFGRDYILITRSGGEWQHLKPVLLGTIMEHFLSGAPVFPDVPPGASDGGQEGLAGEVMQALRLVIDPELGCNIVDLGLVYDVAVGEDGVASILMTTTTRGCPATNYLRQGARDAAMGVEGVASAEVALTYDPPWTPAMMSEMAKMQLGIRA